MGESKKLIELWGEASACKLIRPHRILLRKKPQRYSLRLSDPDVPGVASSRGYQVSLLAIGNHMQVIVIDVDDFDRFLIFQGVRNWPAVNDSLFVVDCALVVCVV